MREMKGNDIYKISIHKDWIRIYLNPKENKVVIDFSIKNGGVSK